MKEASVAESRQMIDWRLKWRRKQLPAPGIDALRTERLSRPGA
jgi:hypothetical protein